MQKCKDYFKVISNYVRLYNFFECQIHHVISQIRFHLNVTILLDTNYFNEYYFLMYKNSLVDGDNKARYDWKIVIPVYTYNSAYQLNYIISNLVILYNTYI